MGTLGGENIPVGGATKEHSDKSTVRHSRMLNIGVDLIVNEYAK